MRREDHGAKPRVSLLMSWGLGEAIRECGPAGPLWWAGVCCADDVIVMTNHST